MPNCTRPPSLALAVMNLNMYTRKKSLPTSSSFTLRFAITTSFASLCTGRKPRGRISHIPQPNWCDATNPRPRGQVLRPGGPTTFRPSCYTSLLSGCAMSSSANEVGKTDALVMCSMRRGGGGGDVYLNPVMGRIKTSPASFVFPLSLRPVRASHLRPCRSSSHLRVTSVTAAGPVRVSGS